MSKDDIDLDVYGLLKNIPHSDDDSYLYIRGEMKEDDISCRLLMHGNSDMIEQMLLTCIKNDSNFASFVLNVTLNYLVDNESSRKVFTEVLTG
jgi:uncharacterized protein YbcC (UPF0753/DUF2309 family)